MSSEVLQPTTQPSGLYPGLHGVHPKKRKSLSEEALEEIRTSWGKFNAGWYNAGDIPERLKLKDVIEDQIRRLLEMVKEVDNEFGALILRQNNEIELAFFQVGKAHEINLAPTRPLLPDEYILGTAHGHPTRDYPSTTDVYTFLKYWEQVGIILGAEGTVYLLLKIKDTITPEITLEEFDKKYESGENVKSMAKDYNFTLYIGNINKSFLRLEVGESDMKEANFENILKDVKGVKTIIKTVKKVRLN